jgi:class 3 adenylate cyclase/tetratricopeptide (TPR) repeat protein
MSPAPTQQWSPSSELAVGSLRCSACSAENPEGKRFCADCGAEMVVRCPSCGAEAQADKRFCGDCGTALNTAAGGPDTTAAVVRSLPGPDSNAPLEGSSTELRHVSVLFCDLVGFTSLSESLDPADVRELLSGYFDLARDIVGRYGGQIEKFIGDAVMAVWGTPVANEDDAERAVRAALELISAVATYGHDRSMDLAARAGIVTGEAATVDTPDEGMVTGDRVNTAARLQSMAAPGACYVDEITRAATFASIAYTSVGEHLLKGKSTPVSVFEAGPVVAARAGSQRAIGLEAPFVGRDHELRLVKDLFHVSAERHSSRLLLVSGVAGVGKSRLAWEFFKYLDGLADSVLWHSGRCLSYGEGVSYWALSEMVRARLQIGEDDSLDVAAVRLRAGLERWIGDPGDREFIEPRLAQLLGLPTKSVLEKEELFAGWRLFFERLAEKQPVVLVVEDLQWADAGLVDFLDHLLDWSSDHAIYLLVLTRPEGADRTGLVLNRRNLTSLSLDPLSNEVMGQVLDGLVADLPSDARTRIIERAEGIPLYAVETVRGLVDGGALSRGADGALHLTGELGDLEIPPGLTALIASRLDALTADERQLVKECAVLGDSFPSQAVGAVTDVDRSALDELLSSLVRKEVLTVRADKLSPERGNYAFTQSLIRSVAYAMLTRSERKARHVRTAAHLRRAFPDGGAEVIEVIAAHLNDAYRDAGDDVDAEDLRSEAITAYRAAGDRAESVGAPAAAETAYLNARDLSADEAERAELNEKLGLIATVLGDEDRAREYFEAAVVAHHSAGRGIEAARVTVELAFRVLNLGRAEESVELLREAVDSLDPATAPPPVIASLEEQLGRSLWYTGRSQESLGHIDQALTLAQHWELPETFAKALQIKAYLNFGMGRVAEAILYMSASLEAAQRDGLVRVEMATQNLLTDLLMCFDRPGAEEHCLAGLVLARRRGARGAEATLTSNLSYVLTVAGRFDEVVQRATELLESGSIPTGPDFQVLNFRLSVLAALRGDIERAHVHAAACEGLDDDGGDVQNAAMIASLRAAVALAEGDHRRALAEAIKAVDIGLTELQIPSHESVRAGFPDAVDSALALGDYDEVDHLVALFAGRPPGDVPPFLHIHVSRAQALVASARGVDAGVEDALADVEATFSELGYRYWQARTQLDLAEWLARRGRSEEARIQAKRAATTFEDLQVTPMAVRARNL